MAKVVLPVTMTGGDEVSSSHGSGHDDENNGKTGKTLDYIGTDGDDVLQLATQSCGK